MNLSLDLDIKELALVLQISNKILLSLPLNF
jgi:hypothetical protein